MDELRHLFQAGMDNPLNYLLLAAALASLGLLAMLTRRSAIGLLLGVELLFNAAGVNFAVFARITGKLDGQVFALFAITVAAAGTIVALSLILTIYKHRASDDLTEASELRK